MSSKPLEDLERFLAGDGKTVNRRKLRRSMGNRKTRKSNRYKGVESTRVKTSEKLSQVKRYSQSKQSIQS